MFFMTTLLWLTTLFQNSLPNCPFKDQLIDYLYDLDLPAVTPESERSEESTIPDEMKNGYASDDTRSTAMSEEIDKHEVETLESKKEEREKQRLRRYSHSVYVRCQAVYPQGKDGKVLTKEQTSLAASCPPSQLASAATCNIPTSAKVADNSLPPSVELSASSPSVSRSRLSCTKSAKEESSETLRSKQHEVLQPSTTTSCPSTPSSTSPPSPSAPKRNKITKDRDLQLFVRH